MKLKLLLVISLLPVFVFGQITHTLQKDRLVIPIAEGELNIIPITDNTIRVQLKKDGMEEKQNLVLINQISTPKFKFSETASKLELSTKAIKVIFDKQSGAIDFADNTSKVFLSEKAGSRKITPNTVMGEPCFIAEQSFDSPTDEYLFGLGQFQDGHYNLRNITRKLIQVNSQIAIPFVYSSKGYGMLWHQYGLTHFNPADNVVSLNKKEVNVEEAKEVEVTTTSGTQKISQRQSLYTGKFTVDKDGEYSMMLDLGDMDNRHLLVIDDIAVIDQSNLWLPPAVSKLVQLKAGEHKVQVVCNATNTPKLSWKLVENATTFRSPHAKSLDYVVFYGNNADEVISSYRDLSGHTPMLPLWAYGFWQCRERYTSSQHLVETVKEFRKRNLPVDVIVQDWQYWGDNGWGVPKLDETNYPNPSTFIKELHDLNAHFAISIWSNPDKNSEIGKDYVKRRLYIPNTKWLDYFNPETSKSYWNTLNDNLFKHGVDAWWMDATEPENDALTGTMTHQGAGDFYRLTYPLFVSKSVFEGQRNTNPNKRVAILTRSAFAGQQRYATINWSGDIGGTWDGYKRQILAGMNFSMTGMPFWTTDIGGFFRPGQGQYTDANFQELLTRWFQWGTFSTIFRIHGYQTETELWKYGQEVEDNARKMLKLRYCLMPYMYAEAWQITSKGSTMMRPMVMDFQEDAKAIEQSFQYMFGQSLLVAPVIEANVKEMQVYLPKSHDWYDFWTGEKFAGGTSISQQTPLDIIPLYVKAGSILPLGPKVQYATEQKWDNLEIRIYAGADGKFVLYEDENDNYNYEKGAYSTIPFTWNNAKSTLTIDDRKGSFAGMIAERTFTIVKAANHKAGGMDVVENPDKVVSYKGKKIVVKLPNQ
jgi:alpha-D-xyloside xylohydrolase